MFARVALALAAAIALADASIVTLGLPSILVELDTNANLKFQVLQGAFPNDDVFANDRKTMPARYSAGAAAVGIIEAACTDGRIGR